MSFQRSYWVIVHKDGSMNRSYGTGSDSPKLYLFKAQAENIAKRCGGKVQEVILKPWPQYDI